MGLNSFYDKLKYEEFFYNNYFKKFLVKLNYDVVFVRYNSSDFIYKEFQKKHDIDVIIDNGVRNISLSLKTTTYKPEYIFFEVVSNCNKNTEGWGYYSRADFIVNCFNYPKCNHVISFRKNKVLKLINERKYRIGYGKTYLNNKVIYKTKGFIIPLSDFEHIRVI
jgi:hypothetical protein